MRKILGFYSALFTDYFTEGTAIADYKAIFKGAGDLTLPLSSLISSITSHITSSDSNKFEGHITQHSQEWCSALMRQKRRTWSPKDSFETTLVQDDGGVAPSTIRDLNIDDVSGLLKAIKLVWEILKAKPDEDDVERLEDQLVGFSFLLSEVPDILTSALHLDSSFYDTLSFLASHTIPVLRYAALKIIRKLCGDTKAEVDRVSLEGLVENMGGIDKFCVALSSCAPEMRRPDGDVYIIRSTRLYLEVIAGLHGSWPEHCRRLYAPQFMVIADNLATDSDGDVDFGLIWGTHRAWKALLQVLFRCEEHEPGFIQHLLSTSSAHEAELKLVIALTPWDHNTFSDSDADPHSGIPAMVRYTIDTWRQQQLSEDDVLLRLEELRYFLKQRIERGVSERQSKAMLDAAREVLTELRPLFVQAGLEKGTENKEEGEMNIEDEDKPEGKGKGKGTDDEDEAQKDEDADEDEDENQHRETGTENAAEHEEAAALESIPPTTGVVNDLETGGDV